MTPHWSHEISPPRQWKLAIAIGASHGQNMKLPQPSGFKKKTPLAAVRQCSGELGRRDFLAAVCVLIRLARGMVIIVKFGALTAARTQAADLDNPR
jgi:hypothetical protein